MRSPFFFICLICLPSLTVFGQKATIVSATSDWTNLAITATDTIATATTATKSSRKAKAETAETAPAKTDVVSAKIPAPKADSKSVLAKNTDAPKEKSTTLLESFADNHNGWLVGKRNGFELAVTKGSYYIRKTDPAITRPGRSYIKLPDNLNLNKADTFTVSVEMVVPADTQLDGGLLIGVKDTSNYCQFRLIGTSKVSLYIRVNGTAMATYMPGKPTAAKVPIDPVRNTLTIRRTGDQLHFFVNGREVEDSPHDYKPFKGNGIGFISFTEATKFQYLTVQAGK